MKRIKKKSFLELALIALTALAVVYSILRLSPGANAAVFEDVTDADTNTAVAVLKSMGVVNGYDNGLFHGDDSLTRAQVCKLMILLAGKGDEVSGSSKKTLFNDVTGSHWAASYINLAYSLGYIKGYGNGYFGSDDAVTYGQAVTMALNVLGYDDSDIGEFWPGDYVSFAASLGLDEGLSAGAYDTLSRSEAAILMLNMLYQGTNNGEDFVSTISSSTLSSALVMSNDATASDGTAVRP